MSGNPFLDVAVKQIGDAILAELQATHPGGQARLNDIRAVVSGFCERYGQPNAVTVEDRDGHAVFVMTDALRAIALAISLPRTNEARP